jgi:hypothetical protein
MIWIVRLALRRPISVVVMAVLVLSSVRHLSSW